MRQILIAGFSVEESYLIQEKIFKALKPCHFHAARTFEDFLSKIKESFFDVVILNHKSTDFDGYLTLRIALEHCPNAVFLLFADLANLDSIIESIRGGVYDHTEKELHDSKVFYKTIFDNSFEGFLVMTDVILDCNESACMILGYSKEEILGSPFIVFSSETQPHNKPSKELVLDYINSAMAGQPQRFNWRFKRKDGLLIDTKISLTPLVVTDRTLLLASFFDITEHKQAIKALSEAEEKYRKIFENAVEGIFQTTRDGKLLTANPALAKMHGYETPEEIIADVEDIAQKLYYDPSQRDFFIQKILKDGSVSNFEARGRRRDGSPFWMSISARVVYDDYGKVKYFEGMIEDITERKRLEAQLRQSQKMEAIGRLAGGVAHDFNNILTAILGYSQLMNMFLRESDPLRGYIEKIITAVERASNLTNSLLAFSRKQVVNLAPINLNDLIKDLIEMLRRIIGEDIELKVFLSEEDLIVLADKNMIEQVLMNLVTNSRDAMPDGGTIIIETDRVVLDKSYIFEYGYGIPGIYALITFTDFGIGMDEDIIQRIFEPFFTTKGLAKGTGLGLSMVYGIIKQHNGYINCFSELGKGTTFKIYLPITTKEPHIKIPPKTLLNLQGSKTILLAEDDREVRNLIRSILEINGYKVIEAEDGADAIEKYLENKDRIDLLLFDLIMPRMNGKLAYDEIRKLKPEIPVLFMSGYTSDVLQQKGIFKEKINLLLKPLSSLKLLTKIRELLP